MVGNGLGPWWFPQFIRRGLTNLGRVFFKEAAWEVHDASYAAGTPARHICDRGFLGAMLRDASEASSTPRMFACTALSWTFWAMCRLFGWMSYKKVRQSRLDQGLE